MKLSPLKAFLLMLVVTFFPQLSVAELPLPLANANHATLNFENCLFKNPSCRFEWLTPSQKQALQAEQARQNFYYCSNNLPQCKPHSRPQTQVWQRQQALNAQKLANQRRQQAQQLRAAAARVYRPAPLYRPVPNRVRPAPVKPVVQRQLPTVVSTPVAGVARPIIARQPNYPAPKLEYAKPSKPAYYESGQVSQNVEYVRGYTRKNGTKVKGYYRTKRDKTITNNFSYYKNVNPYTGQRGHVYPNNFTSSNVTYVSGYYRKDGTYVRGHYRRHRR